MELFVPPLLYEIPYYVAADSEQSRDEYQKHEESRYNDFYVVCSVVSAVIIFTRSV